VPFGVAFGVAGDQAGLSLTEVMAFSLLVFSGSAQFAAVSVLGDGGSVAAAVTAGLLLNLRSVAFGVVMAPALRGRWWWRAAVAQLVIDESTAVGTAQTERRWQRYGFLACGVTVFGLWNLATVAGASVLGRTGDLIETAGIDATIPASFLALLWPRLRSGPQRTAAALGAVIVTATVPVLPPGLPILAAAADALTLRPWRVAR
jgi:predicted branched-subunit amino acid permease